MSKENEGWTENSSGWLGYSACPYHGGIQQLPIAGTHKHVAGQLRSFIRHGRRKFHCLATCPTHPCGETDSTATRPGKMRNLAIFASLCQSVSLEFQVIGPATITSAVEPPTRQEPAEITPAVDFNRKQLRRLRDPSRESFATHRTMAGESLSISLRDLCAALVSRRCQPHCKLHIARSSAAT